MPQASTLDLIASLSRRPTRAQAARELAARLGAEELLLFLPDPQLSALVPAPGFAQTLRGGDAWRTFLANCASAGQTRGLVDLPVARVRPAVAIARADIVAILLGGEVLQHEAAILECALPLLAGMLGGEQAIALADADAIESREAANRANALSAALEAARAEHARLNAQLREQDRRKDEFLAMLAHELRNPLSPLLTSLEILRHRAIGKDVRDRQIEVMARQVSQLSRLVEDLLDVSRVSRGRIELQRRRISLTHLMDDAVEACQPLVQARRHTLTVSMPEAALMVNVDYVRITQVFVNLLSNAAKYTDPGGRLVVSAQHEGQEAVVRIEDNGIGIAPDMLPHVFDLFSQGPVSMERAQGGLGIGLTLVRILLGLHGGSVTAQSPGIGHGSTFIVRLPLAEVDALLAASPVPPAPPEPGHCPLRVLVVDDNRDAADSLAGLLELMGHHAEVAYGGIKALQSVADLDPDLILLDIGLPDMDGYEVARRVRRIARHGARLVALTGHGTDEHKRRTSEAGFDEHVVKPASPEMLNAITQRTAHSRDR